MTKIMKISWNLSLNSYLKKKVTCDIKTQKYRLNLVLMLTLTAVDHGYLSLYYLSSPPNNVVCINAIAHWRQWWKARLIMWTCRWIIQYSWSISGTTIQGPGSHNCCSPYTTRNLITHVPIEPYIDEFLNKSGINFTVICFRLWSKKSCSPYYTLISAVLSISVAGKKLWFSSLSY